jgi:hypothetical protein
MLILTLMAVAPAAVRAGAPILIVTPNPVPVGFGQTGQARISYDSGDGTVPEITMATNNSPDAPVGNVVAPSGSSVAASIAYGGTYLFKMWTPGRGRLLAAVSVTTVRSLSASAPSVANPSTTEILDPPPPTQVTNLTARFIGVRVDSETLSQPRPDSCDTCALVKGIRISFDTWYASTPSVALGIGVPNDGGRFPAGTQIVVLPVDGFSTHHEWVLYPFDYAFRTFEYHTQSYGKQGSVGYDYWDQVYVSISMYDPFNIAASPYFDKLSPRPDFQP